MEKKKTLTFALVTSLSGEELNRNTLKEAFGKFGSIRKIFISATDNFAKIYFDDPGSANRAGTELNGLNNWNVEISTDYKRFADRNLINGNNLDSQQLDRRSVFNQSCATDNSSVYSDAMDEDFVYAGPYVDIHGRPVEVLQSENGQLFVSLDAIRTAGFNIFSKESYNNAVMPKEMEMKEFENYLLNQGMKYILDFKKTFDENEMVRVFEKVRARLQNPETGLHVALGRQVNNTGNSKNFSITTTSPTLPFSHTDASLVAKTNISCGSNHISPQNATSNYQARDRPVKRLPANFQPTHRSFPSKPSNNSVRTEYGREMHDGIQAKPMMRSSENNTNKQDKGRSFNSNSSGRLPRPGGFVPKQNATKQTSDGTEEMWDDKSDVAAVSTARGDRASITSVGVKEKGPLTVPRLQLASGSKYKINVSYVNAEKPKIFFGQKVEDLKILEDILLHVNSVDKNLPTVTPIRDMLCVALFEDIWYRVVVLHSASTDTYVELIDYGNKEHITEPLKEMSAEMKSIPAQAHRFVVNQSNNESCAFEIGEQIEVFIKKQFDDLTYLIDMKTALHTNSDKKPNVTTETSPSVVAKDCIASGAQQEYFTELPASTAKLLPDESVMIVNYIDTQLILRNKETGGICKKVYDHLTAMEMKPISMPKVGQLILCGKDTHEGLHRAVIKEITDTIAEVEFVDYQGGDFVPLKSIRSFDAILASYPNATLTLEYPVLSQLLVDEAEAFLNQLILQKKKLKTTVVNGKIDLIVPTEDNTVLLLSEKLKQLSEPKPALKPTAQPESKLAALPSQPEDKNKEITEPKQTVKSATDEKLPSSSEILKEVDTKEVPVEGPKEATGKGADKYIEVTYADMPFMKAVVGLARYCCYSCADGIVTLLSTSEQSEEYLAQILVVEEPDDNTPYVPSEYVMCLAKFQDAWYRAFVTETVGDKVEVFFVDFGNTEILAKSEMRRFPKRLAEIPLLGITAGFSGIPDNPVVHKRLKELIPDESILEVDVKESSDEELNCKIEIPSIFEKLREEGLI